MFDGLMSVVVARNDENEKECPTPLKSDFRQDAKQEKKI